MSKCRPPRVVREVPEDEEMPEGESGRVLAIPSSDDEPEFEVPETVAILPLRGDVVFPQTVVPLVVNRSAGIRLIDEALIGDRVIGLATQRDPEQDNPGPADLYPTLCVGSILKMLKFPDGSTRIIVQGLARAKLTSMERAEPFLVSDVEGLDEVVQRGVELDALRIMCGRCLTGWWIRASRFRRSCRSRR